MSQVCATAFKTPFVVLTDLEPDDMLALAALTSRTDIQVACVVGGEGNPATKLARLAAYRDKGLFRDTSPALFAGCASAKLFPGETAPPADAAAFDADAFLTCIEAAVADSTANGSVAVLLVLKPPRELNACLAAFPERTRDAFSAMHCALYGSFNVRCMAGESDWLLLPDSPFQKTLLFESFGGFSNGCSNINASTAQPILAALLARSRDFYEDVLQTARIWDEDVVRDCDETCARIAQGPLCTSPEACAAWERNDACRRAVRANMGNQFVAADPVLVVALQAAFDQWLEPITWSKAAGAPYPTITRRDTTDTSTGLWMYRNMDWATFVAACATALSC